MNLEKQVASLELAMRLKNLGVKQDSLFYWVKCREEAVILFIREVYDFESIEFKTFKEVIDFREMHDQTIYSAFTATELGEMLPKQLLVSADSLYFLCYDENDKPEYLHFDNYFEPLSFDEEIKGPDARAKMLIYLIENGLTEIKE